MVTRMWQEMVAPAQAAREGSQPNQHSTIHRGGWGCSHVNIPQLTSKLEGNGCTGVGTEGGVAANSAFNNSLWRVGL